MTVLEKLTHDIIAAYEKYAANTQKDGATPMGLKEWLDHDLDAPEAKQEQCPKAKCRRGAKGRFVKSTPEDDLKAKAEAVEKERGPAPKAEECQTQSESHIYVVDGDGKIYRDQEALDFLGVREEGNEGENEEDPEETPKTQRKTCEEIIPEVFPSVVRIPVRIPRYVSPFDLFDCWPLAW